MDNIVEYLNSFNNIIKFKDFLNEDTNKQWIGVDLDGTLAFYDTWKGIEHIGKPIPKMIAFVKDLINKGNTVKIFTARAIDKKSIPYIQDWLVKNDLPKLEVTNIKDLDMIRLYDDKSIQVKCNKGEFVE